MASRIGTSSRIAALVLLGLATLVAIASGRLLLDGRRHLVDAGRYQAAGESQRELVSLEEAARSYLPGSPYPGRALDRLAILARAQEMRGETARARKTWEVIRRSILSSRHFVQPNTLLLETAERKIEESFAAVPGGDTAPDIVSRPDDPSPLLSLLLFLGLALWIGGSVALLAARSPESGNNLRSLAWFAALGGLSLWLSMSWLTG